MTNRLAIGLFLVAAALWAAPVAAEGMLRVTVGSSFNTLDPAKSTLGEEYIYVHLVFNGLIRIDPDLTIHPDLAESWEASEDLKTWTFKLRQGVKFHNGHVLDAEDVVATVQRILDPKTGSRASSYLDMVATVDLRAGRRGLASGSSWNAPGRGVTDAKALSSGLVHQLHTRGLEPPF